MSERLLRIAGRVVLLVVTAASGLHVLLYLDRWEWMRASIAGVAFIASLVVLATTIVLRRIDRLEQRLAAGVDRPTVAAAPAPPDFRWLAETDVTTMRRHVFIPVLLAAGLLLSVVASAVERLSTAVHAPGRARGDDRQPASLRADAIGATLLVIVAVLGSLGLYQVTHYWEDAEPGRTTLTVEVSVKSRPLRPAETVETVARYCAANTGQGVSVQSVRQVDRETAALTVSPRLGEQAASRYVGCLEDMILERHRLRVTSTTPAP